MALFVLLQGDEATRAKVREPPALGVAASPARTLRQAAAWPVLLHCADVASQPCCSLTGLDVRAWTLPDPADAPGRQSRDSSSVYHQCSSKTLCSSQLWGGCSSSSRPLVGLQRLPLARGLPRHSWVALEDRPGQLPYPLIGPVHAGQQGSQNLRQAAQTVVGCWLAVGISIVVAACIVPVSYEPFWGWLLFYEWTAACFCLLVGAQLQRGYLAASGERQQPVQWQVSAMLLVCCL